MKLIMLLLIMGACNTGKPDNSKPESASPPASTGDTIRTKPAASFTIELGATLGTGFSWSLADTLYNSFLTLDSTKTLNDVQGKDNAPDTQLFFFTGRKKGETTLHFIHARPWRKQDPPDKKRTFTVIIE
jgi:hypothetical protein